MVTISDRNFHRRLLAFYKEYGVTVTMDAGQGNGDERGAGFFRSGSGGKSNPVCVRDGQGMEGNPQRAGKAAEN